MVALVTPTSPDMQCTNPACEISESEKKGIAGKRSPCELTEKCVSACAAYGRVCPCSARIAAHAACDAMEKLTGDSNLFFLGENDFKHLDSNDLQIGSKLGQGGYSNVNACVLATGEESSQQLAIKYLKRESMVDLHHFKHGASDLAVEAFFLHRLDHPNIVKLHGVTAGSVETNFATGKECGFFIVIDRLFSTLEKQIDRWREEESAVHDGFMSRFSNECKKKRKEQINERVKVAIQIAEAMEYLHGLDIVYRDLKPDNCGFDKNGTLKLFDFGLAKELKKGDRKENGRYELTGNTGSRRYMAPEVAKDCAYDKSVDVYSFGILLWELCTTEKPFFGYSSNKHMQRVVLGGERPPMDSQHVHDFPANLKWLMNQCWSPFPVARPTFPQVKRVLADVLESKTVVPPELQRSTEDSSESSPGSVRFSNLFRPQRNRAKSDAHGTKTLGISPLSNSPRSRSWGFGVRK